MTASCAGLYTISRVRLGKCRALRLFAPTFAALFLYATNAPAVGDAPREVPIVTPGLEQPIRRLYTIRPEEGGRRLRERVASLRRVFELEVAINRLQHVQVLRSRGISSMLVATAIAGLDYRVDKIADRRAYVARLEALGDGSSRAWAATEVASDISDSILDEQLLYRALFVVEDALSRLTKDINTAFSCLGDAQEPCSSNVPELLNYVNDVRHRVGILEQRINKSRLKPRGRRYLREVLQYLTQDLDRMGRLSTLQRTVPSPIK